MSADFSTTGQRSYLIRWPTMRQLRRRAAMLVVTALVLVVIAGAALAAIRHLQDRDVATAPIGWTGPIEISSPDHAPAGRSITLTIDADAPDGTVVDVSVFGAVTVEVFTSAIVNGQSAITVPPTNNRHAGVQQAAVRVGASTETVTYELTPGTAADPVVPLVGPRTIVADGADFSMVVVSPVDILGNPVREGTVTDFSVVRPGGVTEGPTAATQGGVAAIYVTAGTEAGETSVAAQVGSATGPANVLTEVAGRPAPFAVIVDDRNPIADGFGLHSVATSELRDEFGNLLPDGVGVVFVIDGPEGRSLLDATVQGAVAATELRAPSQPATLTVHARVSGAESTSITVDFAPAVSSLPVAIRATGDQLVLDVGPVVGTRAGAYPPDDSPVAVGTGPTEVATATLRGGITTLTIERSDLPVNAREFWVRVLGAEQLVEVPE